MKAISELDIPSSYRQNKYCNVLAGICYTLNPGNIVEFGILEGYSTDVFLRSTDAQIVSYDLFESIGDFPGNRSQFHIIHDRFHEDIVEGRLILRPKSFYDAVDDFLDNSIDLIHIDIANDGDVYEFAINNYMRKLTSNGIMILEGGSQERDNVEWMIKYNKRNIGEVIKNTNALVIESFPSITIMRRGYDTII